MEKKFSAIFCEKYVLLYTPKLCALWFGLGQEGAGDGDATFLLKCHALYPICLTSFVVHFSTTIYVSILNLWVGWLMAASSSLRDGKKRRLGYKPQLLKTSHLEVVRHHCCNSKAGTNKYLQRVDRC